MIHSVYITLRDRGLFVLVKAVSWLLIANFKKYIMNSRFIKKSIYSYQMLLDLNDPGISRTLLLFGEREIDHKLMLERVLKPGMVVFDIGANIGYYPLMELGLIGETGKLLAIEPSPSNIELLKKNLALNGYNDTEVISGAVSDSNGTSTFYLSEFSNLNTFHPTGTGEKFVSGETISVETYTVPVLAEKHGKPDLIRMDVEGHEVEVIKGMLKAIESGIIKPMIIFETHLTRYNEEHDIKAIINSLFKAGYEAKIVSSSWQKGTDRIQKLGYKGSEPFKTDGVERVLFENINQQDLVDLVSNTGGVRTVLLSSTAS
jgi:FkbM family methyltransferase